jgi:hypothetical protein
MYVKRSQLKFQESIPNTALLDIAPLLVAAALTGSAELVTAGILFANASKTLKTPFRRKLYSYPRSKVHYNQSDSLPIPRPRDCCTNTDCPVEHLQKCMPYDSR